MRWTQCARKILLREHRHSNHCCEHATQTERLRRPDTGVWNKIRESGVFYHFVPKRYGGLEFDIDSFIDAMLPLSEGCSSTGWVASFCVEHNWMLAQFPEQAQSEIFGEFPYIIAPGVTQPPGKAVRVKGGYRLTGHWKWGTGVMNADWVLASGIDPEGGNPPEVLFFAMPVEDIKILVWCVDGMVERAQRHALLKTCSCFTVFQFWSFTRAAHQVTASDLQNAHAISGSYRSDPCINGAHCAHALRLNVRTQCL